MERLIAVCDNVPNTFRRRLGNETALFFARRPFVRFLFYSKAQRREGEEMQIEK